MSYVERRKREIRGECGPHGRVHHRVRGAAHLPSFAKPAKVDLAYAEQIERGLIQGIERVKAFAEIGKSADAKGTLKALAGWLQDSLIP